MIDISTQSKEVQEAFNKVKGLVNDIRQENDEWFVVGTWPQRINRGQPPAEFYNHNLLDALNDLLTVSTVWEDQNGVA